MPEMISSQASIDTSYLQSRVRFDANSAKIHPCHALQNVERSWCHARKKVKRGLDFLGPNPKLQVAAFSMTTAGDMILLLPDFVSFRMRSVAMKAKPPICHAHLDTSSAAPLQSITAIVTSGDNRAKGWKSYYYIRSR